MGSDMALFILTYNVCWGCMTGDAKDRTASKLAVRCGRELGRQPTQCLLQVAQNIETIEEDFAPNGYDLVGLQEASNWRDLRSRCACLQSMQVVEGRVGREDMVLFYGAKLQLQWHSLGNVSRRPLQVALFHADDRELLVVHLHNGHGKNGAKEVIQSSLAAMDLHDKIDALSDDCVIICLGDWNDPNETIPDFAPFANFDNSKIQKKIVRFQGKLPRSCCSTRENDARRPYAGDSVLSSKPADAAVNMIPLESLLQAGDVQDASDHFPVLATVSLPSKKETASMAGWVPNGKVFCATVGYVKSKYIDSNGTLNTTRRLRLQDDVTDPNDYPWLNGALHRGRQVEKNAPVIELAKPSRRTGTGLSLILARFDKGTCVRK